MKQFLRAHILLIFLVLFATVLRSYRLGEIPLILNPDEASIAYNALLLKETGKDEWGKSWPLVADAFGDQKLIGYPFLVVLMFQLFGYADWVVKVPSLVAGSALIVLAYMLQRQVGRSKVESLLSAGIVSITPVFFFYSRVAFEAMVALVFVLMGLLLLWKSVIPKSKNKNLLEFFSILFFLFGLLTYNSPLLLIPLLLSGFVISQGLLKWKTWIRPVLLTSVVWILFAVAFLPLTQQKSKITLFGDETTLQEYGQRRAALSGVTQKVLGNKYIFYAEKMMINYGRSWSPQFLMINKGGHPWHTMPGFGYLTWSIYLLGALGFISSIIKIALRTVRTKKVEGYDLAILFLFITSLLPAVITVNAPQATRSLLFFFLWCLYAGKGIVEMGSIFSKRIENSNLKIVLVGILFLVMSYEFSLFVTHYFRNYSKDVEQQAMFQPGFDTIIKKVNESYADPIAIVDERGFNYVMLAWYLKISPEDFFSSVIKQNPDRINFKYGEQVGRYHFVAKPADRKPNEQLVLEWDSVQNRWILHEY